MKGIHGERPCLGLIRRSAWSSRAARLHKKVTLLALSQMLFLSKEVAIYAHKVAHAGN